MKSILTKEQFHQLKPGSIWRFRKQNVYIERVENSVLIKKQPNDYIDIRTPFGVEFAKKSSFITTAEYLGMARVTLDKIASGDNLKSIGDFISSIVTDYTEVKR